MFLAIFTLACAGTLIFQCLPVQAAWDMSLRPTAKCYSKDIFTNIGLFNSCRPIPIPILQLTQELSRANGGSNQHRNGRGFRHAPGTDVLQCPGEQTDESVFDGYPESGLLVSASLSLNGRWRSRLIRRRACAAAIIKTVQQAHVFESENAYR